MKIKAFFLLMTVLLTLGGSMMTQIGFAAKNDYSKKNSHLNECPKSKSADKKTCNKDYCNPFQSCSTTPILIAQNIKLADIFSNKVKIYPEVKSKSVSDFYSEHWQPPKS